MITESTIQQRIEKSALLIIDMQHDFLDPGAPYACQDSDQLIRNVSQLSQTMRSIGLPIIYTREVHRRDGVDRGREADSEPLHCIEGSFGVEIVSDLTPHSNDYILNKRRFSAFFQTDLLGLLAGLQSELLIVTGVTAKACVLATVIDAFQNDYLTVTIQECVSGDAGLLFQNNYPELFRLYQFYSNIMPLNTFLPLAAQTSE